jgi:putative IMPACT (imprinted ancient) family translation regulator
MINEQDKKIFEEYYHLYEMLLKHSFIRNYTKETYSQLITLYTKYVSDKHNFSHWCSSCRTELVNHLYQWYINNKEVEAIPVVEVTNEQEIEEQIQVYKKRRKK